MEKYIDSIENKLHNIFENYQKTFSRPAILLSGGIDSSTISKIADKYFDVITLLSFGTQNNKDKTFIELMSKNINRNFVWVEIDEDNLMSVNKKVVELLRASDVEVNTMQISLASGYFLAFQKAHELGIENVITGQGPDILLAGYNKYKKINVEKINEEIKKDLSLLDIDGRRDSAMARHFNIALHNPYLEKEFIDLCLQIPAEYKLQNNIEKYILRQFAKKIGVPEDIVNRPKKAFQYSTGIQSLYNKLTQ